MDAKATFYDHRLVERKWQEKWREAGCFAADADSTRPKFFNFDGGPFPNGPLHMGHVRTFTLGDVMARYQRMRGRNVLYCFEFDAFGLPNELAAEARGEPPQQLTRRNIEMMREQMTRLGLSYDWRHVHNTCDPRYYRWTQWLFLRLLERGLAYRAATALNWCPSCETTLAHMQVEDGRCWRCEAEVKQRMFEQWFIRLSDYSSVLFDTINRAEGYGQRIRHVLKGFMAPVFGVELDFPVIGQPGKVLTAFAPEGTDPARATCLVAAADHREVLALLPSETATFAARKPERLRRDSGVGVDDEESVETGLAVRHPWTGVTLPVRLSRKVTGGFATGIELGGVKSSCGGSGPLGGHKGRRVTHFRMQDWLVSRQLAWGTPIPIVHCGACGIVPVPDDALPVRLPEGLPPKPVGGLAAWPDYADTDCPQCGGAARRDTDTLDCYFDVIWCFLACATQLDDNFAFRPEDFAQWMPVDWFHNGIDSFFYVHLYRFLGHVLNDMGILSLPEPITCYVGHDAVLMGGHKMSKHHGNVVSPDEVLEREGADVLRLQVLGAASPLSSFEWSDDGLTKARRLRAAIWRLAGDRAEIVRAGLADGDAPKVAKLERAVAGAARRVTNFLEQYRYSDCIAEIERLSRLIASYGDKLNQRPDDARLRRGYADAVWHLVLLTAPFAPHLAEELWQRIGGAGLVAVAPWPMPEKASADA